MEHNGHGVLLLDHYDEMAEMLRASFRASGFQGEIISLEDDGFLPEDVLSLYQWFCRDSVDSAEAAVSASADYRVSHAAGRRESRGILIRLSCRITGRSAAVRLPVRCMICINCAAGFFITRSPENVRSVTWTG